MEAPLKVIADVNVSQVEMYYIICCIVIILVIAQVLSIE